jgi:RNA polymerase sigma-70 factor, ECF subfamily
VDERPSLNQRIRNALRPSAVQSLRPAPDAAPPAPAAASGLEAEALDDPMLDAAPSQEEAQLIEAARQDPQAFGSLYELYVERIYAYIYHRVGNVQDAEDLTARTFYRALDSMAGYEDRGAPFAAWLFRIAHNLVANWYRDRSRRRFLSLDKLWGHSEESDTPHQQVEQEETRAALWSAISRLPEERRNLLLFKFGSQLSNLEIGEMMNKSESAIKSLYFRTLAALRSDLEARGWGSGGTSDAAGPALDEAAAVEGVAETDDGPQPQPVGRRGAKEER